MGRARNERTVHKEQFSFFIGVCYSARHMTLHEIAATLMTDGKGILAADESTGTCEKRFSALGIPCTEDTRRAYREMLFTTPGVEEFLSGIILYDETIRQSASDGTPFPDVLAAKNILVGIKVDQGLKDDPAFPDGKVTAGLDGLAERLQEYKSLAAVFAKWRVVVKVGEETGNVALAENSRRLVKYAQICHEKGFVPIIEPELLMDGPHTAAQAEDALVETLAIVFDEFAKSTVDLKGVILKTSMAVTGSENPLRAEAKEVAERTVRALKTSVPENLAGVVFLSGGQSPEEATANLNAMARLEPLPWPLSFSFARALQGPALAAWKGADENIPEAQAALLKRLSLTVAADVAGYTAEMGASA